MHELAVTQGILRIAEREARARGSARINVIKLRLGAFTGFVKEAIEFSFDAIKQGTLAEEARLEIEIVGLRKKCRTCGTEALDGSGCSFLCPRCRGPVEIISGREMQVEYVDLA